MQNHEALRGASAIFSKEPDWVTFYREVLGVEGIVRKLYPTPAEYAEFIKTEEYAEIQRQLNAIREKTKNKSKAEPTRVITVRMPKSIHDWLNWEADQLHTSVNQLCISKLIQWIAKERVPCASEEEIAQQKKQEAAMLAREAAAANSHSQPEYATSMMSG